MSNCNTSNTIKYVENKQINKASVDRHLLTTAAANQWTNFGPLSRQLEARLSEILALDDSLRVVACCNATIALHALISMHSTLHCRSLNWITSAFGFYSSSDGVLAKAVILDCDDDAMLDINEASNKQFDGMIATNVFGQKHEMENYHEYAQKHDKILIIDSAMGFQAGGHIANECISLHHTKPWGFGEGGCAIIHKDNEKLFRSLISFGHDNYDSPINRLAINGKISDIACAYLLMWLEEYDKLKQDHNEQYQRISSIGLECGLSILANTISHPGIPSNVPLLLPKAIKSIPSIGIPFGRYYYPLSNQSRAINIYNRIINIPCHRELRRISNAEIKASLEKLLKLKKTFY
jgi:dTDP-4-amino-4,6-dideoxygalactose transaminase